MGVSDSGAAQAQGSRPYQEDAYVIGPPARYAKASSSSHSGRTQAFFAVYDGHGGKFASAHAARGLHPLLIQSRSFAKGRYEEALREAFAREDAELATHARATNCGCTAVVALVDMNAQKLIVANAGDSRAVLGVQQPAPNGQGVYVRAVRMSVDHQPTIPEEKARIEGLGGFITHDGRVGTLAVSRSLGDHSYKLHANEPPSDAYIVALRPGATPVGDLVSSLPHIASAPLSEHTPFLVIGSDGLFGVLKDQEVVDSVAHLMAARWPAKVIAKHLVEAAVARWGEGAADNVTAVVVIFG
jgi:protein phosphatase 2C family protein 2/3